MNFKTPLEFIEFIEGETSYPWIKITTNSTDKKKTRTVQISAHKVRNEVMLVTKDYNEPAKILYDVSVIKKVQVFDGYDGKKDVWKTIWTTDK